MSAEAAMPMVLPQDSECVHLYITLKCTLKNLHVLLNHNIKSHQSKLLHKKIIKRIAAEIFKTLLQAFTSIQYELFMVCSTLGSHL